MPTQLTLPIRLRDDATLANFYFANNELLLSALPKFIQRESEPYLYLWGYASVGRSHLLQACCHEANQQGLTTAYIPLADIQFLNPSIFDELEKVNLVCIDDVDGIAGQKNWEESLFHLFNRIIANNNRLLIAASTVPKELNITLRDLTSRLNSGLIFQIHELSDQDRLLALQFRAKLRGLELTDEVGQFLLHRVERNLAFLFHTLEKLDQASLAKQRKLTIPFVKQTLAI